jgi:hypothetical protein
MPNQVEARLSAAPGPSQAASAAVPAGLDMNWGTLEGSRVPQGAPGQGRSRGTRKGRGVIRYGMMCIMEMFEVYVTPLTVARAWM